MTEAPDPRLRVLLICHELSLTGAPRLAADIVRTLGPEIELRTISATGGELERPLRDLGPVDVLSWVPRWLCDWRHPAGILAAKVYRRLRAPVLGWRARRWCPDVVYVNSAASILLIPRLGLGGFPILLHVHELTMGLARLTERQRRLVRSLPARYVAVSQVVAEELIDGQGIDRDLVTVVPPLVDPQRIIALAGGAAPVASEDSRPLFVIGGAGNPHWTKGIELWLLMARAVLDSLGQDMVRFSWVGVRDNEAGAEFRAMISKLGLSRNVDLVAETANPYPHFRRFDIFAMTSWEESASLVVLESMALAVPVVSFAGSGGPREQLGDTGVVIESFSPQAMAESIAALLDDPARRSDIGARERARVSAVNDPERIGSLFAPEFTELAGRRNSVDSLRR